MANLSAVTQPARSTLRVFLPWGLLGVLTAAVSAEASQPFEMPYALGFSACMGFFLFDRFRAQKSAETKFEAVAAEVQGSLGLLLAVMAGLVRWQGGLTTQWYGAAVVAMALIATLLRPGTAMLTALGVPFIEGVIYRFGYGHVPAGMLAMHGGVFLVFALANYALLRKRAADNPEPGKNSGSSPASRLQDAAQSYRLVPVASSDTGSTPMPPTVQSAKEAERLMQASVEEIHQAVLYTLDLLQQSMELHSAVLLMLNRKRTHLRAAEVSSNAQEDVLEGPFLAGDGIFGAALASDGPMTLPQLSSGMKLPYYDGEHAVRSVCAIPVIEQGEVRGLLIADKLEEDGFGEKEEDLLEAGSRSCLRAIENERVFVQLERAQAEQGKLYRAAEALGQATDEADVLEAAVESAREIAAFDFAAVTLYEEEDDTHEVHALSGHGVDELLGARFKSNKGLVSMVVKNRHPLPLRGEMGDSKQVVLSERLQMPPMASVLVLPLVVREQTLGTLILAARRKGGLGDAVRPTLEVLARHLAVSLSNARMVKTLEDMATTDGLTGLLNKRALLSVADHKLKAAARFGRQVSVIVTDIDFFKKVNDTYGHDVGDEVIKGLANILKRVKRTTDAVARFGGEEFVLVCEETDSAGALQLAERIRNELGATKFDSPQGEFSVTCSLGISTFPMAGRKWEPLFKCADEALYESKRSGRNQSTAWDAPPPKTKRAA